MSGRSVALSLHYAAITSDTGYLEYFTIIILYIGFSRPGVQRGGGGGVIYAITAAYTSIFI